MHSFIECRRLLVSTSTSWHSEEKVPDFFTASGISGEVSVWQLLPQHWDFPPSPQSGPAPFSVFLQVTSHYYQQHCSRGKNSVGCSASQFCIDRSTGGNLLPRVSMFTLAPTWTAAERGRSLTRGIVGRSLSPWGCRRSSEHRRSTPWWASSCSVGSRLWFCGLCWSGGGEKIGYMWTNSKSRKVIGSGGVRLPLSQPRPECNVWRSSWPCRTSERRTWSSCSPRTPARIRCSRRWTLTWGRPGRSLYRLEANGAVWDTALRSTGSRKLAKKIRGAISLTFGGQQSVQRERPLGRLLHTEPVRDNGKFQIKLQNLATE